MDQQTWAAVATMYNAWNSGTEDKELRLRSIADTVRKLGLLPEAVRNAASRFRAGMVEGQNTAFAPSEPQFIDEARKQDEYLQIKRRPRIQAPVSRPSSSLSPWEMRQQKALRDNAHLPIIKESASFEEFKRMSRDGELPAGALWEPCLTTIYGPEPAQKQAAE